MGNVLYTLLQGIFLVRLSCFVRDQELNLQYQKTHSWPIETVSCLYLCFHFSKLKSSLISYKGKQKVTLFLTILSGFVQCLLFNVNLVEIGIISRAVWSINCYILILVGVPSLNPGKGWGTKYTPYGLCKFMAEDH